MNNPMELHLCRGSSVPGLQMFFSLPTFAVQHARNSSSQFSNFQHSCRCVRTTESVEQGQQLLCSYLDGEDLLRPSSVRQSSLYHSKYFWCRCRRCQEDDCTRKCVLHWRSGRVLSWEEHSIKARGHCQRDSWQCSSRWIIGTGRTLFRCLTPTPNPHPCHFAFWSHRRWAKPGRCQGPTNLADIHTCGFVCFSHMLAPSGGQLYKSKDTGPLPLPLPWQRPTPNRLRLVTKGTRLRRAWA